jgi:hypothetical protein
LTDDEQRELYEAALIIQNAYRRYLKRKHTKLVNNDDISNNNFKQLKSTTVAAAAALIQNVFMQPNISEEEDGKRESINNIEDEIPNDDIVDTKQYEAACIIQKYFRRYKQVSLPLSLSLTFSLSLY